MIANTTLAWLIVATGMFYFMWNVSRCLNEAEVEDSIQLNSEKTVAVDKAYRWKRIDENTPVGVKLQLCNRHAGVAVYGKYTANDNFFDHWAPLPTFGD